MCMALYLATDEPAEGPPLNDASPQFNVQQIKEPEQRVRTQFSKPHIVYLGSHTGCSCGFAYGDSVIASPEDAEEDTSARESVTALRSYLLALLTTSATVELFSCWEGDEGASPDSRLEVTAEHFGGDSFRLPEKQFYLVRRAG
jgi:hypothetical protein